MSPSALNHAIDTWTAKAAVASRFLVGLYRALGDDRQVANAVQAGAHAEEQVTRLGLTAHCAAWRAVFAQENPEELSRESRAWLLLIEAHAGLSAFHCLVKDHERGSSLRGSSTTTEKAFHRSLRGYRVAFPDEMTTPGITKAFEIAAAQCAASFVLQDEGASDAEREELRLELHRSILEGLVQAAIPDQA
jgi:hypothetical protein